MTTELNVALANAATTRAHLVGAESGRLWRRGDTTAAAAARRRYWREVASAARLAGMPWPEAEALGVEGNSSASLTSSPAPAGGMVERVAATIINGQACDHPEERTARNVLLAVAEWLDSQDVGAGRAAARWLREDVQRHG